MPKLAFNPRWMLLGALGAVMLLGNCTLKPRDRMESEHTYHNKGNSVNLTISHPAQYRIVSCEHTSLKVMDPDASAIYMNKAPIDKRLACRVLVPIDIQVGQVNLTIDKIISHLTHQDPDIDEITVWLYKDPTEVQGHYTVGMGTWGVDGRWGRVTPEIAYDNDRSQYRTDYAIGDLSPSQTRWGLSEFKRKKIFKAFLQAEKKADQRTLIYHPDTTTQAYEDSFEHWLEVYRSQIRMRFAISEDTQSHILVEGAKKSWR